MADVPQINLTALLVERDEMNAGVVQQVRTALSEAPNQNRNLRDIADKLEGYLQQGKGDVNKVQLKLGITCYFLGRMERAVELLKGHKAPLAQFYQGLCLIELNRFEDAIKALETAGKSGYAASEVQLHKAAALRGLGRFDEAQKTLEGLEVYVKKTAEYLYQHGCIFQARGNTMGAIDFFEKALVADGRHAGVLFQLAFHNDMQGNDDEAISLYEKSLQLPPARLGTLMNLGVLYEDHTRYERAIACYDQVLAIFPDHSRARMFRLDAAASREQSYDDLDGRGDRYNAVLDMPVTDFELSVRSRNCLKRMNIRTIGDLTRCTEQQLLTSKNFGETSLAEIKAILTIKGLRLGQGLEQAPKRPHPAFNPDEFGPAEQALFNKPVSDLNLSVRARKCMTRLGITTIGELIAHSGDELLECKNFGVTSLVEVRNKLKELNLKLRGD